jgi:hypothetical protein
MFRPILGLGRSNVVCCASLRQEFSQGIGTFATEAMAYHGHGCMNCGLKVQSIKTSTPSIYQVLLVETELLSMSSSIPLATTLTLEIRSNATILGTIWCILGPDGASTSFSAWLVAFAWNGTIFHPNRLPPSISSWRRTLFGMPFAIEDFSLSSNYGL